MIHSPTMQIWTETWHSANSDAFKGIYSEKALIFPPTNPLFKVMKTFSK
ncbi:hypothetical protein CLU97_0255 [Chryseobacterium sp. 7]|nr:hypothetical protein CLU97_0255 [Chryseobacterium sp. 7]